MGVVACDTALGTLLSAGIAPDLVVCLEAQAHNLADFTCLGSGRIPLLADLSSHPAAFRAPRGPKHLSLVRITPQPYPGEDRRGPFRGRPALLPSPAPRVGRRSRRPFAALVLAPGPLLATGLDFSFEPGKTHARGCPSLLAEERRLDRLTRWPGQYVASFRDRTFALRAGVGSPAGGRSGLLSDPILVSYAALLADGAASGGGREPLYDLRAGYGEGRGPSIGGRPIGLERAESLVAGAFDEGRAGRDAGASPRPQPLSADKAAKVASTVIGGELRRLDELKGAMRGSRRAEAADLRGLIAESDYLFWSFPDQDRAMVLSQDFLNRLAVQADYWSYRLGQLAASLA